MFSVLKRTVSLSTHKICFDWEIRTLFFIYTLLPGMFDLSAFAQLSSGVDMPPWFESSSDDTPQFSCTAREDTDESPERSLVAQVISIFYMRSATEYEGHSINNETFSTLSARLMKSGMKLSRLFDFSHAGLLINVCTWFFLSTKIDVVGTQKNRLDCWVRKLTGPMHMYHFRRVT